MENKILCDKNDIENIANTIRNKLGTSELFSFPTLLNLTIEQINNGQSNNVKYVAFMLNGVQLYKKAVIVGDDCVDVIEKGLLETPTKDSTVDKNYLFAGWGLTSEGNVDSDALKNIQQDRVVYAIFSESPRYYTVRFFDGETLVDTVQVPYGGTAHTDYNKNGYDFVGWTPSNINITADTDCYGEWIEGETITDSWEVISEHSQNGTASQVYKVGDTKKIVITNTDGSTETIFVAIAGFGLHRNVDGVKDGITFIQKGYSTNKFIMNDLSVIDIDNDLYDKLPNDLKSVIKQSMIDTKTYDTGTITTDTTTPYLFAPELSNISTSIKDKNGNSRITSSIGNYTIYGTEYSNDKDSGIFPIFKGKTLSELALFFRLSDKNVATRTACGGNTSKLYMSGHIALKANDTYTICKHSYSKNSEIYYTFCFRV